MDWKSAAGGSRFGVLIGAVEIGVGLRLRGV